jgi:hypothetical protein
MLATWPAERYGDVRFPSPIQSVLLQGRCWWPAVSFWVTVGAEDYRQSAHGSGEGGRIRG